jgi:hypothetical protein
MDTIGHLQIVPRIRTVGRREFLGAAGAAALSLKLGILDFASSLFAGEARDNKKPRVQAVFVRPEGERFWMSWPGASYDVHAHQAEYTKTLVDAAGKLGVDLEVRPLPLDDAEGIAAFVEQMRKSPPDGIFASVMHLKSWPKVEYLIKNRGNVPTVVFSPLGTSFAKQLQSVRGVPGTFVAATDDAQWPAFGLRMLKTVFSMKHARLCIVAGMATKDQPIPLLGTCLRYVPLDRWVQELAKVGSTDQMQEIAKYYAIEAKDIVEPKKEDLLAAAKNYVVARRIMAAEKCQGISVDCHPLLNERRVACGMCLAWSKLLDEGLVGGCEADADAAVPLLLSAALLGRPGFMQDPAPNTLRNSLIGSHCTCPTRLDGFERPHVPFSLRSQAESATGVAMEVQWRPGQEVTLMKFRVPDIIVLGTGRVIKSLAGPASTACRTAVEVKVDGLADARNVKDNHQLIVSGKWDEQLRAYAELAGLKIAPI